MPDLYYFSISLNNNITLDVCLKKKSQDFSLGNSGLEVQSEAQVHGILIQLLRVSKEEDVPKSP